MILKVLFKSILTFSFILFLGSISAQIKNIGTPIIQSYYPEDYGADTKNWDIVQDIDGLMYFANHFGLLQFNGSEWKIVTNPINRTFVRSLKFDFNGTLFIGSQNEIGYVKKGTNKQLYYFSLNHLIPDDYKEFDDVWQIFQTQEAIYFFTADFIFKYNYDSLKALKSEYQFSNAFKIDDHIYLFDNNNGIFKLDNDGFKLVLNHSILKQINIRALIKHSPKELLICSEKRGLFYFSNNNLIPASSATNDFLINSGITAAEVISNKYYALGTLGNGILIIDKNEKPIQHLTTETGLQNNNIITLFTDKHNNLWASTGNGIDYILTSSPFSQIKKTNNLYGEIYGTISDKNNIYVATLNGISRANLKNYYNPISDPLNFKKIPDLSGVVWGLSNIDNKIFIASHGGASIILNKSYKNIRQGAGTWSFLKVRNMEDTLLEGTYKGFNVLTKNNNQWVFAKKIKGFDTSCRLFEEDNKGTIWMAHGYQGIYKIEINKNLDSVSFYKKYTTINGLPSNLFNNLYKINNEILIGTEKGIFKYSEKNDTMVEHPLYKKILGNQKHIRLLKEDINNNIWYIIGNDGEEEMGYFKVSNSGNIVKRNMPFQFMQRKHIPGFENLYFNKNQVFIGTKNGLIHYNIDNTNNYNTPFKTHIEKVYVPKQDSLYYGTNLNHSFIQTEEEIMDHKGIFLNANNNDISFTYSAYYYEFNNKTKYSHFLDGYSTEWSHWSSKNEKDFTHLSGGSYTFMVKAMNAYGNESSIGKLHFTIDKPYFLKPSAIALYILLFVLIIFLVNARFKMAKKKLRLEELKKQEKILKEKKKNEIESENKIIRLEQEKMHEKLSSFNMSITQKNELFRSLKKRIEKLIYISKPEVSKQLKTLLSEIEQELDKGSQWQEFQIYFNKTHHDFLNRIQEAYPELTLKDLKFCAYIRMQLSSKEIVSLMNITIRGVEAARLRIRKKLKLEKETHLDDFIVKF